MRKRPPLTLKQAQAALRVCGAYLAERNSGGYQGFNAACEAVEKALRIRSVHECRSDKDTEQRS